MTEKFRDWWCKFSGFFLKKNKLNSKKFQWKKYFKIRVKKKKKRYFVKIYGEKPGTAV